MEPLLSWFDLNGPLPELGPASGVPLSTFDQAVLYAVVVAGVLLAEAVAMARKGRPVAIDLSLPWVAVACIVALVVFPAVWRAIGDMEETSLLVRMGVAAQGGVFWGVVMAGAEKGIAR